MSTNPKILAAVADGDASPSAHALRLTQRCAGVACGIALVALAGWLLDVRILAGQWGKYIPMAPSTALAFLLLGGGVFSHARWPAHDLGRHVALAAAGLAALLGLLVLVDLVAHYDSGIERAIAHTNEMFGRVPLGRMSPLTAAAFLLESGALVLMLTLHAIRWRLAALSAALLALLTILVNLVVLLGYLYSAPLLYGSPVIPVAAPTAVAFVLVGVGQINLLMYRIPALRAWNGGNMRGVLLRAFLPGLLSFIIIEGWIDAAVMEHFPSGNLALWRSGTALTACALIVAITGWVARRTGDAIERTQEALRASEERFRSIIDRTPAGYFLIDRAGRYRHVNTAWLGMHGYDSIDEVIGRHFSLTQVEGDMDAAQQSLDLLLAGGVVPVGEFSRRCRDGSVGHHTFSAHPVIQKGTAVGVEGFMIDITDRKRAEGALYDSEERYQAILRTAMNGFWLADGQGNLLDVNEAYCQMSGYSAQELLAMRIPDWEVTETAADTAAHIENIMARGEDRFESRHRRKDGSIFHVEVGVQYRPAASGRFVAFLQDISERKRAEAEKDKLESQLRQSQKMESVGRLAGGVAHDFNNMLGVILGNAEMALTEVDPAQPVHASLMEIHKAAGRSADLTRQLLAFARKQMVAPQVLDLNQTIAGMLQMLLRLIGEDVRLDWQPGANLWPIKVDPSQIDQILTNLCVNARDAITDIGTITIKTGNSTFDEDYCVAHAGFMPGEYARLAVSDVGCGMDRETLANVFEPFFTTKGVGEGTGLGLATVYGAVKQNRGFIDVCSEPGQGTTFTIYLPRHQDPSQPHATDPPTETTTATRSGPRPVSLLLN